MTLTPRILETSVFADYNSFFLFDEHACLPGADDGWVDEVIADMIAARPGVVCVGTVRRMTVPVTVEIRDNAPPNDLQSWDQVTEAGISIISGTLLLSSDYTTNLNTPRLSVTPDTYRVRAYYGGFDTLSDDGLEGNDSYRLVLWPGQYQLPRVVKRYPGELPGG